MISLTSCEECQSMSASQAILNDVRDEKRAFPIQLRLVFFFGDKDPYSNVLEFPISLDSMSP